jgi:FAD/FMN-containing dehydrogenase
VNNVPGDAKPREIVEDTAVAVEDLPAYIAEFDRLLAEKYGIDCIHYAHAGAGELHLRPLFDLRTPRRPAMFRDVATDVAALVKKYRGSRSAASMATAGSAASSSARWWATSVSNCSSG